MLSEPPQEDTTKPATLQAPAIINSLAATLRPSLFWLAFLLLNLFLFLPAYLLNRADNSLLPPVSSDWQEAARQLLAWRQNLDPFRLNAEFALLFALWIFLPRLRGSRWRNPFLAFAACVYVLALLYAIYEQLSLSFYRDDPIFYAQAQLVFDGLPFVLRHLALSPASFALGGAATVLAFLAIACLLHLLASEQSVSSLGALSRTTLFGLVLLILASFLLNGRALAGPKIVVSCLTCKVGRNIRGSLAMAEQVQSMKQLSFDQAYDYSDYSLLARPDIYLIFIESYGGILYRRQLKEPYLELLGELETELADAGWQAATILSESPTWGGGSWMAYSSALFGLRVDSHPAYLALLDRFGDGDYPHLGRTLQEMGYRHARVTSISVELGEEEWEQYQDFYGTDRWLRYSDLGYNGRHYGWGPAPPDQYVLNAVHEELQKNGEPLFLFMITQNSHYPWQDVPELAAEWQALNDGSEFNPQPNIKTPKVTVDVDDFMRSIRYELQFLTRFILEEVDDDAIFILIGDHQPGYITRPEDGLETPLHILSKDESLAASLTAYGFERGLRLDEPRTGIKHEGLYSLIMRVLLERYGRGDRLPPPYWPDGVQNLEQAE